MLALLVMSHHFLQSTSASRSRSNTIPLRRMAAFWSPIRAQACLMKRNAMHLDRNHHCCRKGALQEEIVIAKNFEKRSKHLNLCRISEANVRHIRLTNMNVKCIVVSRPKRAHSFVGGNMGEGGDAALPPRPIFCHWGG